ncbi:heme biosynthesis protein [Desulfonema ishimotonii]|uniref:Heme biosynthesis protein n=1 Tax=Desulfonema ishimotonii TaxID=45657 RepID=A0A401G0Q7_9BACT|nr:radical SAM protein [Desulfonema ishimotonii]GBC62776.1 heme biosynthesis protein [Desulfonema ishimotonii]
MKTRKTVSFSKNSTNVFFHILTQCNLRCRHCYINREQHGDTMLPLETIESWLAAAARNTGAANVIFLGGEPTLHPDLAPAIRKARVLGYQSVTVDTNGYLFHDILDRVGPDEVDYFSFSLDGATRETNDAIRGAGVYDTCLPNIRKAVARGFHTSLIYTVSNANIGELEMMLPLLGDLGIDRFFIQVIGIRGNSAKAEETLQVSREKWLAVVPDVAEKVADLGITVTFPKVFLAADEAFECAGLCADNYFIFPNGRVYRCPLCEDFPLHALSFDGNRLVPMPGLSEDDFFRLTIPEGCVMNKLIQPDNLSYSPDGTPAYQVACCMLKEEIRKI